MHLQSRRLQRSKGLQQVKWDTPGAEALESEAGPARPLTFRRLGTVYGLSRGEVLNLQSFHVSIPSKLPFTQVGQPVQFMGLTPRSNFSSDLQCAPGLENLDNSLGGVEPRRSSQLSCAETTLIRSSEAR